MLQFPQNFIWGAASSSYQIEGGAFADKKGPSVWDVFSHKPGAIADGTNGDIACDAYHLVEKDLDLMASLGIPNYRFSICWPRVIPDGEGEVDPAGLAYYDRVVDGCLARGITPWITLYHWEMPQALQDRVGGWLGEASAAAFGRYASIIAQHFKGRVTHYFTINEPQCAITLGYGNGEHAPGLKLSMEEVFACQLNILRGHMLAVKAIRAADPTAKVGMASTGGLFYPATESPQDIEAARTLCFNAQGDGMFDVFFSHQWFLDVVLLGRWPQRIPACLQAMAEAAAADFADPPAVDFVGLNIYHGTAARMGEKGPETLSWPVGGPVTAMNWTVSPEVMRWGPRFVAERYGLPVFITENGLSCRDWVSLDGAVHDAQRIDFLQRYLLCLGKGIQEGSNVQGYFQWSFTDNYEWAAGYRERFGLVYVDYATQHRTAKDSAYAYGRWIRQNAIPE